MYPIRFHFLYMLSYTYTLQPFKRPLRCQLDTDGEMCMFSLTVSRTEPKNIKEAMAGPVWIKAMQEELHHTSGGIQFLGGDKLVSWSSKKQDFTSMSTADTEYVSLSACCAQVLWMRTQLIDYGFHFDKIPIFHFIKEQVEKGIVELFFIRTEYQLDDLFTKALSKDRFKYLVRRLGMRCLTPAELETLANDDA
ncbi:hypothetical protein Tco_0806992 [Tanacetum coccineum]